MKEDIKASVHRVLANYLELNNCRKTPERFAILDAIYGINGHFTIGELSSKLTGECHFPISRGTLYNTLRLFAELRLVMRHNIQGSTRYEACYGNGGHSHQVCTLCGKVVEVKSAAVSAAIDGLRLKRFRKEGYSLYIYGVCSTCQARMTRKKSNESKRKSQKTVNNEQRKS